MSASLGCLTAGLADLRLLSPALLRSLDAGADRGRLQRASPGFATALQGAEAIAATARMLPARSTASGAEDDE